MFVLKINWKVSLLPIFKSDNLSINYLKEGQGKPLVFINGGFSKISLLMKPNLKVVENGT